MTEKNGDKSPMFFSVMGLDPLTGWEVMDLKIPSLEKARFSAWNYSGDFEGQVFGVSIYPEVNPILIYIDQHIFMPEPQPILVIEAVYVADQAGYSPHTYSEVICVRSNMDESIEFLRLNGKEDGWETQELIHIGYHFSCYMISEEYLDGGEVADVFIYNSEIKQIMNIDDHRPYLRGGYPEDDLSSVHEIDKDEPY